MLTPCTLIFLGDRNGPAFLYSMHLLCLERFPRMPTLMEGNTCCDHLFFHEINVQKEMSCILSIIHPTQLCCKLSKLGEAKSLLLLKTWSVCTTSHLPSCEQGLFGDRWNSVHLHRWIRTNFSKNKNVNPSLIQYVNKNQNKPNTHKETHP